jgi:hypothetical protein
VLGGVRFDERQISNVLLNLEPVRVINVSYLWDAWSGCLLSVWAFADIRDDATAGPFEEKVDENRDWLR